MPFLDSWIAAGQSAEKVCAELLSAESALTEAHVASAIGRAASGGDHIHASSSMPVRDIDTFASVNCEARISSNRGINGIDGVVSTAAGIAQARADGGLTGRTMVLIGDVALLQDVGGVLDAARHGVSLLIVCPNNDGGGIFSMLPAKKALDADTFDALFQTRHGTNFEFLGHYPGIHHEHIDTNEEKALETAIRTAESNREASVTILELSLIHI